MTETHKYFEKIVVLQNQTGRIIRIMIMHDGQRNYSLKRSNSFNGVTKHFNNKKIWHSLYHVNLILDRQLEEYEAKGYDVIDEFSLNINRPAKTQFKFDNHKLEAGRPMLKVSHKAIPIAVSANFDGVDIIDMRYRTEVTQTALVDLFNAVSHNIHFIPFTFTGIFDPETNTLTSLSVDYRSKPDPKAYYTFDYLVNNSGCDGIMKFAHYENSTSLCDCSGTYAKFENDILTFHFAQWKAVNLILELDSIADQSFKLYSMKNHRHCLVHTMQLPYKHNHQAMFLLNETAGEVSEIIYLNQTVHTKTVSETPYLLEVKTEMPKPISVEQLFNHFLPI
ncbi:hypothetical protein [Shewanella sp. UCD-KL12]|uniref:hypothetical protein n=1 Tax=Shewanella sp. UCD-KL12 TaxID=1917163 RepID=UPI0009714334|nr:hypothetical protein [Shewanella sp. UCD-KL12]